MKNTLSIEKLAIFLVLAIMVIVSGEAAAQKTPNVRDDTLLITSRVFTTEIKGDESERVFAFWADKGEVVLKIKTTAKNANAGAYLNFYDKNDEDLTDLILTQGVAGMPTETITQKIRFDRKTLVYLQIKEISYGSSANYRGTLQIAFGGSFIEGKAKNQRAID
ncbi:MAG TPA: hypothetical protein PKE69_17600 [Pyrinomonadaceae bacterium]|nr:hypothetical protein [Pyrinomonadaceae bacterium]